jgi:hypothetical protein
MLGGDADAITLQCRDGSGVLLNSVLYGPACTHNPPCGGGTKSTMCAQTMVA